MTSFDKLNFVRGWVQYTLPLVYDDSLSYLEMVGKLMKTTNSLVENNNKLPNFIYEMLRELLLDGAVESIVAEVMANTIINVKFPPAMIEPAKGDGVTNDTETIQQCINYARANGYHAIFFPSGNYLTDQLYTTASISITGNGRYNTSLNLLPNAENALIKADCDTLQVSNITLNVNRSVQVNAVSAIYANITSGLFYNLIIKDANTSMRINATNDCTIDNVIAEKIVKMGLLCEGGVFNVNNLDVQDAAATADCFIQNATSNSYFNFNLRGNPIKSIINTGDNCTFDGAILGNSEHNIGGLGNNVNIHGKYQSINAVDGYTLNAALTRFLGSEFSVDSTTTNINSDVVNVLGDNFNINTTNPIKYKTPFKISEQFSTIPMTDGDNDYNVLVQGEKFNPKPDISYNGLASSSSFNVDEMYNDDGVDGVSIGQDFYSTNKPEKDLNTFTIATYNILSTNYFRWPLNPPCDTDTGLARALATIIKSGAKIVTLNELSYSPKYNQPQKLCKIRFSDCYFEKIWHDALLNTTLGNGILSTNDFIMYDKTTIKYENEDRYLVNAKTNINGKTLSIYTTHLSLDENKRIEQLNFVISKMGNDQTKYKLLMGDLNFPPYAPEYNIIKNAGYINTNDNLFTFESTNPYSTIDYIWKTPNIITNSYGVLSDPLASDHSLLWSNITLS